MPFIRPERTVAALMALEQTQDVFLQQASPAEGSGGCFCAI